MLWNGSFWKVEAGYSSLCASMILQTARIIWSVKRDKNAKTDINRVMLAVPPRTLFEIYLASFQHSICVT